MKSTLCVGAASGCDGCFPGGILKKPWLFDCEAVASKPDIHVSVWCLFTAQSLFNIAKVFSATFFFFFFSLPAGKYQHSTPDQDDVFNVRTKHAVSSPDRNSWRRDTNFRLWSCLLTLMTLLRLFKYTDVRTCSPGVGPEWKSQGYVQWFIESIANKMIILLHLAALALSETLSRRIVNKKWGARERKRSGATPLAVAFHQLTTPTAWWWKYAGHINHFSVRNLQADRNQVGKELNEKHLCTSRFFKGGARGGPLCPVPYCPSIPPPSPLIPLFLWLCCLVFQPLLWSTLRDFPHTCCMEDLSLCSA